MFSQLAFKMEQSIWNLNIWTEVQLKTYISWCSFPKLAGLSLNSLVCKHIFMIINYNNKFDNDNDESNYAVQT